MLNVRYLKALAYVKVSYHYKRRLQKFGYYGIEDKNQNKIRFALTWHANLAYNNPESKINTEPLKILKSFFQNEVSSWLLVKVVSENTKRFH